MISRLNPLNKPKGFFSIETPHGQKDFQ